MSDAAAQRSLRALFGSIVFLAVLAFPRWALANGSDLPPEIVLRGFVKSDEGRTQLLVRVPLALLASISLPKRGPGYLDLARIDIALKQAAAATGRQIELSVDGALLAPTIREVRLSLLSDRSFASYAAALAHLQGPPLPVDTDLFWTQGFLDVEFDYALPSPRPNIWIRLNALPEVGQRIKLQLESLPLGAPARTYEIQGTSGWIPLDPRWYDAAWFFVKVGFVDTFAIDRFAFLLCLVAPFRRFRGVLTVVMVSIALQGLTLTAGAEGALADIEIGWLPAFSDTVIAAGMMLLAIANLASPSLRRRWLIAASVGALGGFGLGRLLADAGQFAGNHPLVAVASFNVGVALGEVVGMALAFFALRALFAAVRSPSLGVIVVSAIVGHASWHWMVDGGRELWRQVGYTGAAGFWSASVVVAMWLAPALLVGIAACFLPRRFDGVTVPTLLRTLQVIRD
jgi:hypothetical protein